MKKIVISIVCTVLFVVLLGVVRLSFVAPHAMSSRFDYQRFWLNKTYCPAEYNIILLGDSRVKNGLSPLHMEKILDGHTVLNFGYNQLFVNHYIINAAKAKMVADHSQHIMVIGIAAGAFSEQSNNGNGLYKEFIEKGRMNYLALKYFGPFLKWIALVSNPVNLDDFTRREGLEGRLIKKYWENGWMSVEASDVQEEEVVEMVQEGVRDQQDAIIIPQTAIKKTVQEIEKLVVEGVKVFLIRMPTNALYEQFENKYYGFDERMIRHQMEEVGGVWLDIDKTRYSTFDGVHLKKSSAEDLSTTVAAMIKEKLKFDSASISNAKLNSPEKGISK